MLRGYIKKVKLENYKCFQSSEISFRDLCIIVGKNNAGKSSLIEALRLISAAGKRAQNSVYIPVSPSLGFSAFTRGFSIDTGKLKISLSGAVYFYTNNVARITATFSDRTQIVIAITEEIAFACLFDPDGNNITKSSIAKDYCFDQINILPQIGLIKEKEKLLSQDTVKADQNTYLTSRHFRNEIWLNRIERFQTFKQIAEESWDGLRIKEIIFNPAEDDFISLLLEDARFPAEIGVMGSGLQMWLQMIWFITRSIGCQVIILDEPDVYMHPDLQRKILRVVQKRFPQVIIATHSVEIISDVEPQNIITIDKRERTMKYANDSQAVQKIIDDIGGVQNIALLRIGNARKCLFVEGKDVDIISKFGDIISPDTSLFLKTLPCVSLGGYSRLSDAYGAAKLFERTTRGTIKCFCVADRDYRSDVEIKEKENQAKENCLLLHIWRRKEIENYILNPKVIYRIVKDNKPSVTEVEFLSFFTNAIDEFSIRVLDQYSANYSLSNGGSKNVITCNEQARKFMIENWTSLDNKLKLVPGKDALKRIMELLKEKYKISSSITSIIKAFRPDEIDSEIKEEIENLLN